MLVVVKQRREAREGEEAKRDDDAFLPPSLILKALPNVLSISPHPRPHHPRLTIQLVHGCIMRMSVRGAGRGGVCGLVCRECS